MIAIRQEIAEVEEGEADRVDNVLKNAPHTHRAAACRLDAALFAGEGVLPAALARVTTNTGRRSGASTMSMAIAIWSAPARRSTAYREAAE